MSINIVFLTAVCGVSAFVPHQYVFVNESKTWTEAQNYCRQTYTDLATINTMEEMKKLNATLKDKPSGSVWIGLSRGGTGKWLWSLADGGFYSEGDTYRNWNSGEPNNAGNKEFCVGMFWDKGTWFDVKCDDRYPFTCYDEKKTNTERYVFINEEKSWYEAQSYCRDHHTDLVRVRNQTENQQVFNLIKQHPPNRDRVWIGLFYDSWTWSDQSDSSFRYWKSGPDHYGQGAECAAVSITEKGRWDNEICSNRLPFICHQNKLILIQQNLTWREALAYCMEKHLDLVSVHSEEIQLWVKEVAQKASTEHVWLGLRHTCTLGFWYWVSGESICYQNWAPGAVPVLYVPKQDSSTRFCVDYCRLDRCPLLHVQKILESLHGASRFSTIGFKSGYWQISLDHISVQILGTPAYLVCHQGVEFTSHLLHVTCKQWGLVQKLTTDNYPQTNFTERIKHICKALTASYLYDKPFVTPVRSLASRVPGQEMDQNWVSITFFYFSAVCGVSALVPHQYVFVNESKTWTEAQNYCRQNYTDLATINTMEEMKKTWSDGSDSSFRYWKSGPDHCGQGADCAAVSITEKGRWDNEICSNRLPFICHQNKLILIQQNLTWREALWYCREKHLDLVSVHSEEIQLWVMEVVQKASTEHVWLGLRHTCTLGFWYWVSGESICYQNWAPGNGTGGEDCVSVERTGAVQSGGEHQWVSLLENQELNFICTTYEEMDQNWVSITFFFFSAVCGVSAHVPYRYVFVSESKTWTEAQNYCRQTYTDLATINTMEEMKKLNTTLKDKPSSSVWIGLSRGGTGKWLWSLADGGFYSEQDTYRNWASGEPNNYAGKEFCVAMKNDVETWFDDRCDAPFTSVCYDEKKTNTERYVFINEKKSWYEAQSYCRDRHTDLVRVRNQTENQQVFNLTKQSHSASHTWIGLFNDSWTWSDQSDSSFRYWKSGPDDYVQGAECAAVSMTEKGRWDNKNCNNKLPFICHQKLILIQENLTWSEALWYCREKHLDLVSVHSEEIQLWVKEVAQKASTEHVWLGLRHTCTLGFWYWVSGESICYQNWAPGNGTGGEDCVSVERTGAVQSGGKQQWVSLPEDQELNFICTTYEEMDQNWVSITFFFLSAVCGVSAHVPHQYVFVNESKTWNEAQNYCRQTYTDLATINTMEEMKNLNTTLKDKPSSSVWTGKKTNTERYVFINEKKSWYEAQSYCRDRHSDLVRVRNQTENQQVFNLTKQSHSDSHIWIGLFNDSWTWSDQSDSSFRYWKSGPDHYGQGAECAAVSITEKGQWGNETCSNQLPFICYQNKLILIQQNLTWSEALWYCREKHLDLVSVHSEEIQLWVKEVAQKASTEHVCGWVSVTPVLRVSGT
ncbi:hypothetical protein NFI96_029301, partial [Prochilodus magdalenae]